MGNLQTQQVYSNSQKALVSGDLPFEPCGHLMLHVESCANEETNGYFHKKWGTQTK